MRYSELFCGIHSRIPLCCIMWYLTGWCPNDRELLKEMRDAWLGVAGFVKCPDCIATTIEGRNNMKKTKKCNCNNTYAYDSIYYVGAPFGGFSISSLDRLKVRNKRIPLCILRQNSILCVPIS